MELGSRTRKVTFMHLDKSNSHSWIKINHFLNKGGLLMKLTFLIVILELLCAHTHTINLNLNHQDQSNTNL
jgi:hypothetical protein